MSEWCPLSSNTACWSRFAVEDVISAREELAMAGIELIGELVWAADVTGDPADQGWGWCFFRAPDGNVYVLQQDGGSRDD